MPRSSICDALASCRYYCRTTLRTAENPETMLEILYYLDRVKKPGADA